MDFLEAGVSGYPLAESFPDSLMTKGRCDRKGSEQAICTMHFQPSDADELIAALCHDEMAKMIGDIFMRQS